MLSPVRQPSAIAAHIWQLADVTVAVSGYCILDAIGTCEWGCLGIASL